ncbi:MAG: hypothetical protein ACK45H_11000, partial [Bacteroidota bacterium]
MKKQRKILLTKYYDPYRLISFNVVQLYGRYVKYAKDGAEIDQSVYSSFDSLYNQIENHLNFNEFSKIERKKIIEAAIEFIGESASKVKFYGTAERFRPDFNSFQSHVNNQLKKLIVGSIPHTEVHPFPSDEAYDLFLYLDKWMQPTNKVKYSYIFDEMKHKGYQINERQYFEYVVKLTGLD